MIMLDSKNTGLFNLTSNVKTSFVDEPWLGEAQNVPRKVTYEPWLGEAQNVGLQPKNNTIKNILGGVGDILTMANKSQNTEVVQGKYGYGTYDPVTGQYTYIQTAKKSSSNIILYLLLALAGYFIIKKF